MESIRKPDYKIKYNNKDVTNEFKPFIRAIFYTDFCHGKADNLEITIEDSYNLAQIYKPAKGDIIELLLGGENEELLPCGVFEVDELDFFGLPDMLILKCISTNISKSLRENKTFAYENKSLKQIITEIAARHNLTLIENIENIKFKRLTQYETSDLEYLKSLADKYGYIFKITSGKLVFYSIKELENKTPVFVITKSQMSNYHFKDKSVNIYKSCRVHYHNAFENKTFVHIEENKNILSSDTLDLNCICENKQQAIKLCEAALHRSNRLEIKGCFEMPGYQKIMAGVNISINGFYALNGTYLVIKSKHNLNQNGYKTGVEVIKIAD